MEQDVSDGIHSKELASSSEAIGALARDTAYDINNLAGVILGSTAGMRRLAEEHPELAPHLARIDDACEKVSHLAERLLGVIQGKARPPLSVNLNQFVCHALQFEEQASEGTLRVTRFLDPDLWPIMADPNQLTSVVLNLTLNAYEAAGSTGRINVVTQNMEIDADAARPLRLSPGRYILLSVEDNGQGMHAAELARVFESGFTTKGEGRGKGLSTAYRIVKDHKGYITIRSEPGIGTTVDVYWPIASAAPKAQEPAESELRGSETILVIDDEPLMVQVVRESLSSLGYHVLTATNGREALDTSAAYEGTIHVALLDMAMPIMGGAETYPLLQKQRPGIRIVVMSGYDLGSVGKALKDAGVSGVLQKPFRIGRLAGLVRSALDNHAGTKSQLTSTS